MVVVVRLESGGGLGRCGLVEMFLGVGAGGGAPVWFAGLRLAVVCVMWEWQ